MATIFLSTANPFYLPFSTSCSSSHSSSLAATTFVFPSKCYAKRQLTLCKAVEQPALQVPIQTKRSLSINFLTGIVLSLAGKTFSEANAVILEADDDVELLEKVKRDRKKRLEKQGVISSSGKETGSMLSKLDKFARYLQGLVYKLSKVGQAIENNDLSTAGSVLGGSTDVDWVQKANAAFNKLSSSPEEKTAMETFNSSIASLISSVAKNDVGSSKVAFVSSASALEKWTTLTGLVGQLKGL